MLHNSEQKHTYAIGLGYFIIVFCALSQQTIIHTVTHPTLLSDDHCCHWLFFKNH